MLFERANTGYGGDLHIAQIEGSRGAFAWDWLGWEGTKIRKHHEPEPGHYTVDKEEGSQENGLSCHDYPLLALEGRLAGRPNQCITGDEAVFNFSVLNAIAEAATTGKQVTVSR